MAPPSVSHKERPKAEPGTSVGEAGDSDTCFDRDPRVIPFNTLQPEAIANGFVRPDVRWLE